MATESSAVVRFIKTAEQGAAIQDPSRPAAEGTGTNNAPIVGRPSGRPPSAPSTRSSRRSRASRWRASLLIMAALALAGAAGTVGVYVGKRHARAEVDGQAPAAPSPVAAAAVAPAAAARVAPAPSAAPSAVGPAAIRPDVLAATGFDIRVKPPATIRLDGRVLGMAPLRVRNLVPGPHAIDIEAPSGFFSRRVEIELDPGEPQNVNLALDPIELGAGAGEAAASDERARDEDRVRRRRRGSAGQPASASSAARPAAEKGTLMLGSKPPCDIYIDGAPTGLKTPQRAIELPAGTHRVTLINPDLAVKASFTVEISAGRTTRSIQDLTGKLR
jgi:hypothetical protein